MSISDNLLFQRLTESSIEYVAESMLGGNSARFSFIGPFDGRTVLWNATLVALRGKNENQYIELQPSAIDNTYVVEIGLQVAEINEPTVIKAIKMIRQYKNLHLGRHEFSGINK